MPMCNSYGFSGGLAAICASLAWFLVQEHKCGNYLLNTFSGKFDIDQLQMFHYIAIIVGVVLFVLSFFDFAGILYEIKLLFIAASIGVFAAAAVMFYASYISFHVSCKSDIGGIGTILNTGKAPENVIEASDQIGMGIFVLDLLSACALISAAISFTRTY